MIGVFVLPFIIEIKTNLKLLISFYIIPAIFQLGILYFYNIESHNEFINFNNQEIFAFQVSNIQLEYIFMMCYLGLTLNYLKYFLRKSSKKQENLKKSEKKPNLFFILLIIVVRNSDIVSFIILFFISMYTVNLIHSILVIFFFVYLIIKVTYFPKINALSFVEMKLLYWKFLIVYLDIILFVKYSLFIFHFLKIFYRYSWELFIFKNIKFDVEQIKIIDMIGLPYFYEISILLGIDGRDYGSTTIIWILYIFVILQYKVLKSSLFRSSRVMFLFDFFKMNI